MVEENKFFNKNDLIEGETYVSSVNFNLYTNMATVVVRECIDSPDDGLILSASGKAITMSLSDFVKDFSYFFKFIIDDEVEEND